MNLAAAFHPLTNEAIRRALSTHTLGHHLHLLPDCESTNTLALEHGLAGAADGTVIVTEQQRAGRGRLGRAWFSPAGQSICCSVLLRSTSPIRDPGLWLNWVPLLAGVAAARAVHGITGLRAILKWPNDVLVGDRKVAGILCESTGVNRPDGFVVVGIGLNVNVRADSFPEDLRTIATSLAIELGRPVSRAACLAAVLNELEMQRDRWMRDGVEGLRAEYLARCSTIGRLVRVECAGQEPIEGVAESIAEDGALELRLPPGTKGGAASRRTVRAGDVIHLRSLGFEGD